MGAVGWWQLIISVGPGQGQAPAGWLTSPPSGSESKNKRLRAGELCVGCALKKTRKWGKICGKEVKMMNSQKKQRCYIYTRVSTQMQVEKYSLDAQ